MAKVLINAAGIYLDAEIFDNPTGNEIINLLPLKGKVHLWGNEIYFNIGIPLPLEKNAVEEVNPGDIAYWPEGKAFCVFFGPTPISTGEKPKAYSPVNVFGKIIGDATVLIHLRQGNEIEVSLVK